nr:probable pre-mRNA-splicing factor ATP-dependent RNA helicase DEAH4 isoform X1 [Tanacetum cinerariifolium]
MEWWLEPKKRRVPTVTNIAVTNELEVVAYGVVAWTQRGVPIVTNIAVTIEDVGSSKGEVHLSSVLRTYVARKRHRGPVSRPGNVLKMGNARKGARREEDCTVREARGSTSFKYTTWILAMQCSWTLMSIRMNHPFHEGKDLPVRMNIGGMLNTCKSDEKWCFQWRTGRTRFLDFGTLIFPNTRFRPRATLLRTDDEGVFPNYAVYHELISTSHPYMGNVCEVEMEWVTPILKKLEKLNVKILGYIRFPNILFTLSASIPTYMHI